MKLKKPKFWDYQKPNLISNILLPLSKILHLLLKFQIKKEKKFKQIKSICVGNVYLGGTGKTTLSIQLKKILDKENIKSCFIKKKYKNQTDEQVLLLNNGETFIHKSRVKALQDAIYEKYEVAIFDDGLQEKNISYDLSFICFNQKNMIGNGRLIPSGPLRESLDILNKNKNVFLIGNDENNIVFKNILKSGYQNLNFYDCVYEPLNLDEIEKNKNYVVFSGIGNHETFIDMLKKNKFKILEDFEYPDHYNYSIDDLNKIHLYAKKYNAKILTTEKDFLRIKSEDQKNIQYVSVNLKIKQIEKLKETLDLINENN